MRWVRAVGFAVICVASACGGSSSSTSGTVGADGELVLELDEARLRVSDPSLAGRELRLERLEEDLIPDAVTRVYRFEPTGLVFAGAAEVCFRVPVPSESGIAWGEFMALEMLETTVDGDRVCAPVEHFSIGAGTMALSGDASVDVAGDVLMDVSDAGVDPTDAGMDASVDGIPPPNRCDPDWSPATCMVDADCDDQCHCNGTETCVAGACLAGTDVECDDGVECTTDQCYDDVRRCRHFPETDELYDPTSACWYDNSDCSRAELITPGVYGRGSEFRRFGQTFRVNVPTTSDLVVKAFGPRTRYSMEVRRWTDCESGPALEASGHPVHAPVVRVRSAAPGDYAIIINAWDADFGYDLDVQLLPATAPLSTETCDAATTEIVDGTGGPYYGSDSDLRYFRLTLATTTDVAFDLRTAGAFVTDPSGVELSILPDCEGAALSRDALQGGRLIRVLPAGSYVVRIDPRPRLGLDDAQWWTMDVSLVEPRLIPGDLCQTAIDVTSGPASIDAAPLEANLPYSVEPYAGYADAAFFFDLEESRDVEVQVTGAATSFGGGAMVATECGNIDAVIASNFNVATFRALDPGRYWIIATTEGEGTLTAEVRQSAPTPIPTNDGCTGAIPLSDGLVRNDTLVGFADDVEGHIPAPDGGLVDSFYSIDLDVRSLVTIDVDPVAAPSSASLTVRDSCFGIANLAIGDGDPASLMIDLNPGLYFVIVESAVETDYTIRSTITPL